jgi:hypothetical protein
MALAKILAPIARSWGVTVDMLPSFTAEKINRQRSQTNIPDKNAKWLR